MSAPANTVICPECERMIAVVSSRQAIRAAMNAHTCETPHHPTRGNTMSAPALHTVPDAGKRPHPKQLVDHPDKRIARAAQRVMDAVEKLDEAWEANSAKAELRAKRDALKQQLAAVEAELKGTAAPKPAEVKVDWKAVRAWAEANGYEVPKVGRIGQSIVDAYNAAQ